MSKSISRLVATLLIVLMWTAPAFAAAKAARQEPSLSAESCMLMCASSSEEIYAKHKERKINPGRIAELVSVMVVIDSIRNNEEYSNKLKISQNAANQGDLFEVGDKVSVDNLIKAAIIAGSKEAVIALSQYTASSLEIFTKEMNAKVQSMGLLDTEFLSPIATDDNKEYSTAADIAVILQTASRYEKIMEFGETKDATIKIGEKRVNISNQNPLVQTPPNSKTIKAGIGILSIGTQGSQYAGIVSDGDLLFAIVLLNSKANSIYADAVTLANYGSKYSHRDIIVDAGKYVGTVRIKGGRSTRVSVYTASNGYLYIPEEGSESLVSTEVYVRDDIEAPVAAGTTVGEYRIYVADELKGTAPLCIHQDVPRGWIFSQYYIPDFAVITIGLFILIFAGLLARRRLRLRAINAAKAKERRARIEEIALREIAREDDKRERNWTH